MMLSRERRDCMAIYYVINQILKIRFGRSLEGFLVLSWYGLFPGGRQNALTASGPSQKDKIF
jgi:hypothetical protein